MIFQTDPPRKTKIVDKKFTLHPGSCHNFEKKFFPPPSPQEVVVSCTLIKNVYV
jgi:hypothetical protein